MIPKPAAPKVKDFDDPTAFDEALNITKEIVNDMTNEPAAHNSYTMRIVEKPLTLEYKGDAEKCHPAIIKGVCLEIRVSRAEDYGDPKEDAAFIVKCVNAHEELVNALKETHGSHFSPRPECSICELIANAEGKL